MTISVLVVDDSISARAAVNASLAGADVSCVDACDGEEALDLLRSSRFDLVISDLWMPRMTGTDLVRAVRAEPSLATIPILAITADREGLSEDSLREAGVTGILAKPFTGEELRAAVDRLVGGRQ